MKKPGRYHRQDFCPEMLASFVGFRDERAQVRLESRSHSNGQSATRTSKLCLSSLKIADRRHERLFSRLRASLRVNFYFHPDSSPSHSRDGSYVSSPSGKWSWDHQSFFFPVALIRDNEGLFTCGFRSPDRRSRT